MRSAATQWSYVEREGDAMSKHLREIPVSLRPSPLLALSEVRTLLEREK
jgi:hypothetical protein